MGFETLIYRIRENVAEVTLDQPEKHNPLSDAASEELLSVFEEIAKTDDAHCVLLTGAGESFCAGGDLEEFSEQLERDAIETYTEDKAATEFFKLISAFEKPIVGAINGNAFGGGCGLAAACHVAYAAPEARLGTPEVSIGIFPMLIMPVLERRIGEQKAMALALTGRHLDAAEAADLGLVDHCVTEGDVHERARETAQAIASKSPFAVQLGLHLTKVTADMPTSERMDAMNAYRALYFQSNDLNEGAQAFLEDRKPKWEGR